MSALPLELAPRPTMNEVLRRDTAAIISGIRQSKGSATRAACRREFLERFYPVLRSYFQQLKRRRNLWQLEEDEWAGEVAVKLVTRLECIEKRIQYHSREQFVGYVRKAAENAWSDFCRSRGRNPEQVTDPALIGELVPGELPSELADDIERQALLSAAEQLLRQESRISERDWRIFELLTKSPGQSPDEVAARFQMTRSAVDMVKFRIINRLRTIVRRLEEETP